MSRSGLVKAMKKYTVKYARDEEGWWVASVRGIVGCHTQGRTIEQSRKRIREALELFIDDVDKVKLVDEIVLPAHAKTLINNVQANRKRAQEEADKLQKTAAEAARVLTQDVGVSIRDAGEILGLSHQRVHQLLLGKDNS